MRGSSCKGPSNSMYKTCIVIDFEDTLMPQDRHIVTKQQSKWTWTFYLFNVHPTLPLTLMVGRNSMLNISKSLDASTNLLGWEYNNKVFQHQIKKKAKWKLLPCEVMVVTRSSMVRQQWFESGGDKVVVVRQCWLEGGDNEVMMQS